MKEKTNSSRLDKIRKHLDIDIFSIPFDDNDKENNYGNNCTCLLSLMFFSLFIALLTYNIINSESITYSNNEAFLNSNKEFGLDRNDLFYMNFYYYDSNSEGESKKIFLDKEKLNSIFSFEINAKLSNNSWVSSNNEIENESFTDISECDLYSDNKNILNKNIVINKDEFLKDYNISKSFYFCLPSSLYANYNEKEIPSTTNILYNYIKISMNDSDVLLNNSIVYLETFIINSYFSTKNNEDTHSKPEIIYQIINNTQIIQNNQHIKDEVVITKNILSENDNLCIYNSNKLQEKSSYKTFNFINNIYSIINDSTLTSSTSNLNFYQLDFKTSLTLNHIITINKNIWEIALKNLLIFIVLYYIIKKPIYYYNLNDFYDNIYKEIENKENECINSGFLSFSKLNIQLNNYLQIRNKIYQDIGIYFNEEENDILYDECFKYLRNSKIVFRNKKDFRLSKHFKRISDKDSNAIINNDNIYNHGGIRNNEIKEK